MKVLFLDFDGPLFPDRNRRFHPDNIKEYPGKLVPDSDWMKRLRYWKMDEIGVDFLNRLQNIYPFRVVVSSTWRRYCSKELVEELFEINNLDLVLHDDWKTPDRTFRSCRRVEEVNEWLEEHPEVEDFIVLDDKSSAKSIYGVLEYKERQRAEKLRREWEVSQGNIDYPLNKYIENIHPRINQDRVVFVNEEFGISTYNYWFMETIVNRWAGIPEKKVDPLVYAFF